MHSAAACGGVEGLDWHPGLSSALAASCNHSMALPAVGTPTRRLSTYGAPWRYGMAASAAAPPRKACLLVACLLHVPVLPQATRSASVSMAIANPSKALPFLEAPACQSSGLAGAETGFDPLYLSNFMDIKWLREAELKHGRICMLASTGYVMQEFFSLPSYPGYSPNPVEAFSSVPAEGLAQIVIFMGWLEIIGNKGKYSMSEMFADPARAPGNLGFDPLKFGANAATRERLEMAELKNGRLAMLAFSGMIHQTFVTGKPLFASLSEIFSPP